jgi:HNH endonuclease
VGMDLVYSRMEVAFRRNVTRTKHGLEWALTGRPYGTVTWVEEGKRRNRRAHVVAWILVNGEIPAGYEIDHRPDCPKTCVTVEHLRMLTKSEHTSLGWQRGELNGGWGTKRQRIHPPRPPAFSWKTEQQCRGCGATFLPNTARQIYCTNDCQRQIKEKRRSDRRYPRQEPRPCAFCGTIFQPKRSDSTMCSRACIDADQNRKKAERRLAEPGTRNG